MTTTLLEKDLMTDTLTAEIPTSFYNTPRKQAVNRVKETVADYADSRPATQKAVKIVVTDALGRYPQPGKKLFVSDEEGKKIFPLVKEALENDRFVLLSFEGLDPTGGFVHEAVGKLYGDFTMDFVDDNLEVVGLDELSEYTLEGTLRITKLYYYRREAYDRIMAEFRC